MKRLFCITAMLTLCGPVFAQTAAPPHKKAPASPKKAQTAPAPPVTGQTASAPPIKMGLWEQTTVTTIKVNLPNAVNGKPQTVVSQTCITPETWREAYDPQGGDKGGDLGCKIKNLKQSASGFSADITCGTSSGHTQTTFESPEKITGSMHIDTAPGDKQPGFMEQTFVSVYKGADCKDIAPGDEKLISD